MDTLQCAVVLAKLERFEWELAQRARIADRYESLLANLPGVQTIRVRSDRNSVYAQYTVIVEHRDAVAAALKAQGVPTAVHYPRALNQQPAYARYCCPECCVNSRWAAEHVLSLPMSADLSEADQDRVVAALGLAVAAQATAPALAI